MQDHPKETDRFKPKMPRIPGVGGSLSSGGGISAQISQSLKLSPRLMLVLSLAALIAITGIAWRRVQTARVRRHASASTASSEMPPVVQAAPPVLVPAFSPPPGPIVIAKLSELQKPWSEKQFTFVKSDGATVPAMVVRLPDIPGDRSSAYWGFSLAAPYGNCNLDYVRDLKELARLYDYSASHPMVAAACDHTLYDPLRLGITPAGAWVRGEVAAGSGIRPPISIRIQVQGQSLIADRME